MLLQTKKKENISAEVDVHCNYLTLLPFSQLAQRYIQYVACFYARACCLTPIYAAPNDHPLAFIDFRATFF